MNLNISLESKRETQIIFFKRSMQTSKNRNCKHRAQIKPTFIKNKIYLQEKYQISYTERLHCKIIQLRPVEAKMPHACFGPIESDRTLTHAWKNIHFQWKGSGDLQPDNFLRVEFRAEENGNIIGGIVYKWQNNNKIRSFLHNFAHVIVIFTDNYQTRAHYTYHSTIRFSSFLTHLCRNSQKRGSNHRHCIWIESVSNASELLWFEPPFHTDSSRLVSLSNAFSIAAAIENAQNKSEH